MPTIDPAPVDAEPAFGAPPLRPRPATLASAFVVLLALDQWTKNLVATRLDPTAALAVIPRWFYLVYWTNGGAAWGSFQNAGSFFLGLAVVALIVLLVLYRRRTFAAPWMSVGLCLLLPGIVGNLTDRIARGRVVDFLLFDLHFPGARPFPAFNVADSCICVAVSCFLIGSWLESPPAKKS